MDNKVFSNKNIDIKKLIDSGDYFIVCDTNVFLGLYSCSPDFPLFALECLEAVREYIKIPYTVKIEYFNHNKELYGKRKNIINNISKTFDKSIDSQQNSMINTINGVLRNHFPDAEELIDNISDKYVELKEIIDSYIDEHQVLEILCENWKEDIVEDFIKRLINDGHLLEDFSRDEIYRLCDEGKNRYEKKTPPGFKDAKNKDGIRKYSDLILWKEVIRLARDSNKNIIFVTDDIKSDWWSYEDNKYIFLDKLINEFERKSTILDHKNENKDIRKRIIPFISADFYDCISKYYHIHKSEAIEQALEITCDKYIDSIKDSVWDEVWNQFQYSGVDYFDEDILSSVGTLGIDEWVLDEYNYDSGEIYSKSFDEIIYSLTYRLTFSGVSREYAGKDDDGYIMSMLAYNHKISGCIIVQVVREYDEYLDINFDDGYKNIRIVSTSFCENECEPNFDEWYVAEESYTVCPKCGRPISFNNDGGNGFCVDCEQDD